MKYDIAIVIPCYNEEENINELYESIVNSIKKSDKIKKYKLYIFNDCSTDNTLHEIKEIDDKNIVIINGTRKMGKSAGLEIAFNIIPKDVDLVFMMDADLQDDPKEFDNFIKNIEKGYDLVSGYKKIRYDSLEKRLASKLYNKILNLVFNMNLHDHNCGFKCFRRDALSNLKIYENLHRFITVFINSYGLEVSEIEVKHHKRKHGKSKYGISRYFIGLKDIIKVKFILDHDKKSWIVNDLFVNSILLLITYFLNKNLAIIFFILMISIYIILMLNLKKYKNFTCNKIKCFELINYK